MDRPSRGSAGEYAPLPEEQQAAPPQRLRDSLDNAGTTHKIEQLELKLLRRRDLYTFAGEITISASTAC